MSKPGTTLEKRDQLTPTAVEIAVARDREHSTTYQQMAANITRQAASHQQDKQNSPKRERISFIND